MSASLKLTARILLIRLPLLWLGIHLYSGFADWRQVVGHALTILTSFVELPFVRHWRNDHVIWVILLTLAVVSTSTAFSFALTAFRRYRNRSN
jgi:hypothetical protein